MAAMPSFWQFIIRRLHASPTDGFSLSHIRPIRQVSPEVLFMLASKSEKPRSSKSPLP